MSVIRQVGEKVFASMGKTIGYKIGTMIEIPRAALVADQVGNKACEEVYLHIPMLI